MARERVIVIGAGMGGLAAAMDLAARGLEVLVLESFGAPGGKMREVAVGGRAIDAGPTVFTMRWVFDEIFESAGASLDDHLTLRPASMLARYAWDDGRTFDFFADRDRTADAIAAFAGPDEAHRFRAFCERARSIYDTLEQSFIAASKPNLVSLCARIGFTKWDQLWGIQPYERLWTVLGKYFHDPRLRQLFARFSTYCGGSPYASPATLMLVAHVEQQGVWLVEGGMHRLPCAMAEVAAQCGATIRYGARVDEILLCDGAAAGVALETGERIPADAVVSNADVAAFSRGLLGPAVRKAADAPGRRTRSLSAMTWSAVAKTSGLTPARHTVCFSGDYRREFDELFRCRTMPSEPTVYVCAQDRDDAGERFGNGAESLFCLVNAPPIGDRHTFTRSEIDQCQDAMIRQLSQCGLTVDLEPDLTTVTTPSDFSRLYPGSGGALYGRAPHGWMASFLRPGSRSRVPGLYIASGTAHPGPGAPMAALSGRLAAMSLLKDRVSMRRFHPVVMSGGILTR